MRVQLFTEIVAHIHTLYATTHEPLLEIRGMPEEQQNEGRVTG